MKRGFTLIEIMFTMMVFSTVVVSLAVVFMGIAGLGESSRNMTQAMSDARTIMEGIRESSTGGLAAVTATNWTTWATNNGLTSLPNEAVTVTYVNPAVDPLAVTVQISWIERGRARTATVDTMVTRR